MAAIWANHEPDLAIRYPGIAGKQKGKLYLMSLVCGKGRAMPGAHRFAPRRIIVGLATAGLAVLSVTGAATAAMAAPSVPGTASAVTPSAVHPDDGTPFNCNFTKNRPTLFEGISDHVAAVKQAQCYLNDALIFTSVPLLAVDGQFGPKTDAATRDFQRCQHISIDGEIGPVTWRHLKTAADNPAADGCT